jgi:hypothetical protein
MAAPSNKLTARRRLSCSSLLDDSRMQARPKETPPEVTAREAGFVLDGVRVTHACPLRSKFVEASDDPIGSVYVRPRPLAALDDAALAMRETYVSSSSPSPIRCVLTLSCTDVSDWRASWHSLDGRAWFAVRG